MELTDLYKRLGQMINIREDIRKEITSFQSESGNNTGRLKDRINSLEDEYNRVQQQVIKIDSEIRKLELARAAARG